MTYSSASLNKLFWFLPVFFSHLTEGVLLLLYVLGEICCAAYPEPCKIYSSSRIFPKDRLVAVFSPSTTPAFCYDWASFHTMILFAVNRLSSQLHGSSYNRTFHHFINSNLAKLCFASFTFSSPFWFPVELSKNVKNLLRVKQSRKGKIN